MINELEGHDCEYGSDQYYRIPEIADDHSYPMTEVAPLKADDLGCAGKVR